MAKRKQQQQQEDGDQELKLGRRCLGDAPDIHYDIIEKDWLLGKPGSCRLCASARAIQRATGAYMVEAKAPTTLVIWRNGTRWEYPTDEFHLAVIKTNDGENGAKGIPCSPTLTGGKIYRTRCTEDKRVFACSVSIEEKPWQKTRMKRIGGKMMPVRRKRVKL